MKRRLDTMKHNESTFQGAGGLQLYCQHWRPEEEIRAVLVQPEIPPSILDFSSSLNQGESL